MNCLGKHVNVGAAPTGALAVRSISQPLRGQLASRENPRLTVNADTTPMTANVIREKSRKVERPLLPQTIL